MNMNMFCITITHIQNGGKSQPSESSAREKAIVIAANCSCEQEYLLTLQFHKQNIRLTSWI